MAYSTCPSCKRSWNLSVCPLCQILNVFQEFHPSLDQLENVGKESPDDLARKRAEQFEIAFQQAQKRPLDDIELRRIKKNLELILQDIRRAPNGVRLKKTIEEAIGVAQAECSRSQYAN